MPGQTPQAIKDDLTRQAGDLGFADVGVAAVADLPDVMTPLRAFVDKGRHGQMGWMADRIAWRGDPARAVARKRGRSSCWPIFTRLMATRWTGWRARIAQ